MLRCETKLANIFGLLRYSNRTLKFHVHFSPDFPHHLSWGCTDLLTESSKYNSEVTEALQKKKK